MWLRSARIRVRTPPPREEALEVVEEGFLGTFLSFRASAKPGIEGVKEGGRRDSWSMTMSKGLSCRNCFSSGSLDLRPPQFHCRMRSAFGFGGVMVVAGGD